LSELGSLEAEDEDDDDEDEAASTAADAAAVEEGVPFFCEDEVADLATTGALAAVCKAMDFFFFGEGLTSAVASGFVVFSVALTGATGFLVLGFKTTGATGVVSLEVVDVTGAVLTLRVAIRALNSGLVSTSSKISFISLSVSLADAVVTTEGCAASAGSSSSRSSVNTGRGGAINCVFDGEDDEEDEDVALVPLDIMSRLVA